MERRTLPSDPLATTALFQEVSQQISLAQQILILGPGVAKHHFQNFLNEHHPSLSKKIVACEAMDFPSDFEIADCATHFFKI
jgi:stalled ribosome rescue protein Dom34